MKRTVKFLVGAACITSMIGVGAVSFAQWDGATSNGGSGELATGYVSMTGFTDDVTLNFSNAIVPYDQGASTPSNAVTYYSLALPEYQATNDYEITIKVENVTLAEGSAFYAQLSTAELEEAPAALTGWQAVTGTAEALTLPDGYAYTTEGEVVQSHTVYLNIVLKSDNGEDMRKTGAKFTVVLSEVVNNG